MGHRTAAVLVGAALALMIGPSGAKAAEEVVARIKPYGGDSRLDYPVLTVIRRDGQTIARLSAGTWVTDLPGEAVWRRLQTSEGWEAPPPPGPPMSFDPDERGIPVVALPPLCHAQSVQIELALPGEPANSRDVRATCRPNPPWDFAAELYLAAITADPVCARLLDRRHVFYLAERCLMLQGAREAAMEVSALLTVYPDRGRVYRGLSATAVEVAWTADGHAMKQVWTKDADGRWTIER